MKWLRMNLSQYPLKDSITECQYLGWREFERNRLQRKNQSAEELQRPQDQQEQLQDTQSTQEHNCLFSLFYLCMFTQALFQFIKGTSLVPKYQHESSPGGFWLTGWPAASPAEPGGLDAPHREDLGWGWMLLWTWRGKGGRERWKWQQTMQWWLHRAKTTTDTVILT